MSVTHKHKLRLAVSFALLFLILGITNTTELDSLKYDASTYVNRAIELSTENLFLVFFSANSSFIDLGYPIFLATIIKIFGQSIFVLQSANVFLWLANCLIIYKLLGERKNGWAIIIFALPLYWTFSLKIYSETFAALGMTMCLYALVKWYRDEKHNYLLFALGLLILVSTKTMFVYLFAIWGAEAIISKRPNLLMVLFATAIILIPRLSASKAGSRLEFNLSIQAQKLDLEYNQLFKCSIYNFSYPVGLLLWPEEQGTSPSPEMPGYKSNPYLAARREVNKLDLINGYLESPLKTISVFLSSLTSFVFFEGIYSDVLVKLPGYVQIIGGLLKFFLSISLWLMVIKTWHKAAVEKVKWLYPVWAAVFGFFAVVVFFPIEQRYIYPLLPLIYFLALIRF